MHVSNPIFAIITFGIAYLTAFCIRTLFKLKSLEGRNETLDGLRGFLGLGVFIHHATIWYQYIHTNRWEAPTSKLYNQLGQTSVALFFMITSFLFISKLIDKERVFDWKHFFISRLYRLVPMYYLTLFLLFITIFSISQFEINTCSFEFIRSVSNWLTFTIYRAPLINDSEFTSICAASIWTLPYEWLFYMSLPLLSFLFLRNTPKNRLLLLISIGFLIGFYEFHGIVMPFLYAFLGGAIAPFLVKYNLISTPKRNTIASCFVIVLMGLILQFQTAENSWCLGLITIVFTLIALGTDLFRLLKNETLKFLGEISYSTYLLHSLLLFVTFYFGIGFNTASTLSDTGYKLVIFAITPILIVVSVLGYVFIEQPFMKKGKRFSKKNN